MKGRSVVHVRCVVQVGEFQKCGSRFDPGHSSACRVRSFNCLVSNDQVFRSAHSPTSTSTCSSCRRKRPSCGGFNRWCARASQKRTQCEEEASTHYALSNRVRTERTHTSDGFSMVRMALEWLCHGVQGCCRWRTESLESRPCLGQVLPFTWPLNVPV